MMSNLIKAKKTTVAIGTSNVQGYMLPNGDYTLAYNSTTQPLYRNRSSLTQFLNGRSPEALSCQKFNPHELPKIRVGNSSTPIKPVPIFAASAYWRYWECQGDYIARKLVMALTTGQLINLLDDAFGIKRTKEQTEAFLTVLLSPDAIGRLLQPKISNEPIKPPNTASHTTTEPAKLDPFKQNYLQYAREIFDMPSLTYSDLEANFANPIKYYAVKELDETIALKAFADDKEIQNIQMILGRSPYVENLVRVNEKSNEAKQYCYQYLCERIVAAKDRYNKKNRKQVEINYQLAFTKQN